MAHFLCPHHLEPFFKPFWIHGTLVQRYNQTDSAYIKEILRHSNYLFVIHTKIMTEIIRLWWCLHYTVARLNPRDKAMDQSDWNTEMNLNYKKRTCRVYSVNLTDWDCWEIRLKDFSLEAAPESIATNLEATTLYHDRWSLDENGTKQNMQTTLLLHAVMWKNLWKK